MKDVGIEWLVVDSAAGTRGDALRDAVRRADAMIVPVSPSIFDMAATAHFLAAIAEYKAIREGLAVALVAMRVDARTRAAGELDEFLKQSEFPLVTHLRDTQVYVYCARDGYSVFDLPRSRGEQDWEQWKPLTRWIARHAAVKASRKTAVAKRRSRELGDLLASAANAEANRRAPPAIRL